VACVTFAKYPSRTSPAAVDAPAAAVEDEAVEDADPELWSAVETYAAMTITSDTTIHPAAIAAAAADKALRITLAPRTGTVRDFDVGTASSRAAARRSDIGCHR